MRAYDMGHSRGLKMSPRDYFTSRREKEKYLHTSAEYWHGVELKFTTTILLSSYDEVSHMTATSPISGRAYRRFIHDFLFSCTAGHMAVEDSLSTPSFVEKQERRTSSNYSREIAESESLSGDTRGVERARPPARCTGHMPVQEVEL